MPSQITEPPQGPAESSTSAHQQPPTKRQRRTATELYPSKYLESKKDAAKTVDEHIVAWLEKQIEQVSGYNTWQDSQGKVLSNPKIVDAWSFVGSVITKYNKKWYSNIPVCVMIHQFLAVADKIKPGTPWSANGAEETHQNGLEAN